MKLRVSMSGFLDLVCIFFLSPVLCAFNQDLAWAWELVQEFSPYQFNLKLADIILFWFDCIPNVPCFILASLHGSLKNRVILGVEKGHLHVLSNLYHQNKFLFLLLDTFLNCFRTGQTKDVVVDYLLMILVWYWYYANWTQP